jgi:Uma2 family endonuclease
MFMVATTPSISLAAFLTLPETKPASEYIDGKVLQKPMPKRQHSLLQSELCTAINAAAKPPKINAQSSLQLIAVEQRLGF